jgi:uncharacterized membrane protein (GlpM family)
MAAKPNEMLRRAAFGAGVSVVAAIVGAVFGSRVGGLFLACPAILPATLTLIEKKDGKREAEEDEHGSIAGAIGLVAFAAAGVLLIDPFGVAVAMVGATIAWGAASIAAYAVHLAVHERNKSTQRARDRLHHG